MNRLKKKINMVVEKTDTGFSAYSEEYPIFTTAESIPELVNSAYEAMNFYFEEQELDVSEENVQFDIDFKQFFQYYKVLNSKFLAEKIGMNPSLLSQYEKGSKKPFSKQTEKILSGIHQIDKELSEINLIYKH
ncbi:MAG: helix-turn-helix transcriptional regulator [Bacteroidales bacterium]|nr:helix-turn-helix transcriptional regulator [Bacteroidales bacterium]